MRLLYLTEDVPNRHPEFGDGSSMIPYEILRNLPDSATVTLMTFAGRVPTPGPVRDRCETVHVLPTRPQRSALARSAFGLTGMGRQLRSTPAARALAAELSAGHDATLVHGPHALFLSHALVGPMVLQAVDPWSIRAGMEAAMAPRGLRVAYRARARWALAAERRLPDRARLLTVSARDARAWSASLGRPVRSVQNGADSGARSSAAPGAPTVCFVGSLNYGPNIDSVRVLIGTVAPLVWDRLPSAEFVIAGRQPDAAVLALTAPRVRVLGNVPSVGAVFQGADIAAFPDQHGVGVRNSVREALAAGTPVVATPVAAREQEAHPLLWVEEEMDAFVARTVGLLEAAVQARQAPPAGRPAAEASASDTRVRTWRHATEEYLDELRLATRSSLRSL